MRPSLLAILAEQSTSYGFAETETHQEAVDQVLSQIIAKGEIGWFVFVQVTKKTNI